MKILAPAFVLFLVTQTPCFAGVMDLDEDDQADFFDSVLNNGDQATSGPLTITFSNIVTAGGPGGQIDGDGIYFGRNSAEDTVISMDMVFSENVVLDAYDVDFAFFPFFLPPATFTISGPNGVSGANPFTPVLSSGNYLPFDMGTIPFFMAGQTYSLTHDVFDIEIGQIDELHFTVVPEPSTASLMLVGFASTVFLRRRRS